MVMTVTARRRPVEIARRVPVGIEAAVDVLKHGSERLIGADFAASWMVTDGSETLGIDLPGGMHVSREVRVGFGPVFQDDDAFVLAVWWEAAEHPQLFPTFDGGFEVRAAGDATDLRLVGSYEPPLGALGRFADGVVGHRLVAASLDALLDSAAERLIAAAASNAG
ncbi:MAG TPA: hypothetical protein VJS45_13595 [Acidimicrobiia bacterium]|jgi:hypothetical protein|nr:hypothetical protein [Acidimicrobiia bacterium]